MKIRAFDGSRQDAQGIIKVNRATFGDCHYTSEYILSLESDPGQYAWVAEQGGQIVGFVSAFATHSLMARRWEIDELAVRPQAQGCGIGTALVARAVQEGVDHGVLAHARALVAVDNHASARVFSKCGFAPADTVHLMLYSVEGRAPRPRRNGSPIIRFAQPSERLVIERLSGREPVPGAAGLDGSETAYLIAGSDREIPAYAELIHVRTLQYEGFWIESLVVSGRGDYRRGEHRREQRFVSALLSGAIEEAKRRESLDEVGLLVSLEATSLYAAAVGEGFHESGQYRVFLRELST